MRSSRAKEIFGWKKALLHRYLSQTLFQYKCCNQAPGPGSYRSPSEFGQYDVKKDLRASTSHMERMKNGSSNTDRTKVSNTMKMSQEV